MTAQYPENESGQQIQLADKHECVSEDSDDQSSLRRALLCAIDQLNDMELAPLLFKAGRLLKGQQKYGENYRGKRDWQKEMVEELDDFINYWVWGELE